MTLKKEKNHVLFKTLCNNFVRFLSQQSSPDMIIYVSQSIRQNINIFRISLVPSNLTPAKNSQIDPDLSCSLGPV